MDTRLRDGLLALVALAVLLRITVGVGATGDLTDGRAVAAGVVGSLVLEAVFLRYPERTRQVWERPVVQGLSLLAVVGLGVVAVQSDLTLVIAALVWGLLTYLLLLVVVVGTGGNPLGRLV